jgi:GNAT superfamily N-acetyltransferase
MTLNHIEDLDHLYRLASDVFAATGADATVFVPHPGDLAWWAAYLEAGMPLSAVSARSIRDARGELAGWGFLSPDGVDAFAFPARDACRFDAYDEGIESLESAGATSCAVTWIADTDPAGVAWATSRGFARGESGYLRMSRGLDSGAVPDASEGMLIGVAEAAYAEDAARRATRGLPLFDLRSRALAQRSAFSSSRSEDEYLKRFLSFVASPAWGYAIDCAVGTPSVSGEPAGSVDAFARVWLEPRSAVALLEPVGVRQGRQGMGLGKLAAESALALAYRAGMRFARVTPDRSDERVVALYRSLGFRDTGVLPTRVRSLP